VSSTHGEQRTARRAYRTPLAKAVFPGSSDLA
jgi:hypothetical protein